MNSKERAELGKQLLPLLPGFVVKGPLVFAAPITNTLRALYLDAERYKREWFQVQAFILPLYVPQEEISFNFGRRLRRERTWDISEPDTIDVLKSIVVAQALPILADLETPLDTAAAIAQWAKYPRDMYAEEAIAYSLVLAGDIDTALRAIDRAIEYVQSFASVPCDFRLIERAKLIKSKLLADPNDAKAQLGEWRKETLRHLKLEKYAEEVYTP